MSIGTFRSPKVIVPFITRLVFFSIAGAPPTACRYLSNNWSGSGPFGSFASALSLFPFVRFAHHWFRRFRHHRRHSHWIGAASVTGIAGHFAMPLKVVLIDGEHHLHHLPRSLLGLLVVFLECALYVTEFALHAQRRRNELHPGN